MSKSPETDECASHDGNWDTKALRMQALASKLEIERDEAREQAETWRNKWCQAKATGSVHYEGLLKHNKLPWEK